MSVGGVLVEFRTEPGLGSQAIAKTVSTRHEFGTQTDTIAVLTQQELSTQAVSTIQRQEFGTQTDAQVEVVAEVVSSHHEFDTQASSQQESGNKPILALTPVFEEALAYLRQDSGSVDDELGYLDLVGPVQSLHKRVRSQSLRKQSLPRPPVRRNSWVNSKVVGGKLGAMQSYAAAVTSYW